MYFNFLVAVISFCIFIFGAYHLIKEKNDKDSVKAYGIISVISVIVFAVNIIKFF